MKTDTRSLDHPILFVGDYGNPDLAIPEYSSEVVASATPSCVSVRVIVYLDGDVTVRLESLAEAIPQDGFFCVFDGTILTPSRKIAVLTAENEVVLETDVAGDVTAVKVSVNRTDFPDELLVLVG